MAEKQPTKQTGSGSKSRSKTNKKQSEAVEPARFTPPKVVSAIGQGGFLVREAPSKCQEMSPDVLKIDIKIPTSSNAESQTYVTGSKHGAVVHSSVSGKVETNKSGQSTPNSD